MRKARILVPNGTYHVTTRINRKEMLLEKKEEKKRLLNVIKRANKKYSFILMNFTIMGNHVHLIIRPTNGSNLSRILQWIESVFAMDWNRRHSMTGHFWGERFHSRIISGLIDLANVFNYIDENPVRAGLVKKASDWKNGGLYFHLSGMKTFQNPLTTWLRQALLTKKTLMLPLLN